LSWKAEKQAKGTGIHYDARIKNVDKRNGGSDEKGFGPDCKKMGPVAKSNTSFPGGSIAFGVYFVP
jgi:hypothetical protein